MCHLMIASCITTCRTLVTLHTPTCLHQAASYFAFPWSKHLGLFAYVIAFPLWLLLYFSPANVIFFNAFIEFTKQVHDVVPSMVRFPSRVFHHATLYFAFPWPKSLRLLAYIIIFPLRLLL